MAPCAPPVFLAHQYQRVEAALAGGTNVVRKQMIRAQPFAVVGPPDPSWMKDPACATLLGVGFVNVTTGPAAPTNPEPVMLDPAETVPEPHEDFATGAFLCLPVASRNDVDPVGSSMGMSRTGPRASSPPDSDVCRVKDASAARASMQVTSTSPYVPCWSHCCGHRSTNPDQIG